MSEVNLNIICLEGESLSVEFKERPSHLDREMVAFANAAGGTIYLGIRDDGSIAGIKVDNSLRSQITDIARNCDPSVSIELDEYPDDGVLAIRVPKGTDKPYRCKDGFFVRNGPSCQKLKRDEILNLLSQSGSLRFDESVHPRFRYPTDFSRETLEDYLKLCGIAVKADPADVLVSLNVAQEVDNDIKLTNAGVLFFAKDPQKWLPESYLTCVRYKTGDRFSIIDKKDFYGSPVQQIEEALSFVLRHMNVEARIDSSPTSFQGRREDVYDYAPVALREAIVNAVVHRDYAYDSSHIYLHMFPSYLEIENPGGLFRGLSVENLGKRSVRRNRLIADLLHRAGYIERVGSGFDRMRNALEINQNPPLEVSSSNFFNIRFYPRLDDVQLKNLSQRQRELLTVLQTRETISKRDAALSLGVSDDTALRELKHLISFGVVSKEGVGRATIYRLKRS